MRKLLFTLFIITVFSTSNIFAQKMTPKEYVERFKMTAIQNRFDYKIPAAITLAQGILESGIGGSYLATNANNHFGIKCHSDWKGKRIYKDDDAKDECFRVYKNADESYRDHALFLTGKSRYEFLFTYKITDYKKWAKGLKKAGYATNPKYPTRLIDIIEKYDLAQYDYLSKDDFEKMKPVDPKQTDEVVDTINNTTIVKTRKTQELSNKNNHKVAYKNRVRSIIVLKNESVVDIARKFDISPRRIYKYNDLPSGTPIKAGMRLYLQPKRYKGDVKYHIVKSGETIWSISQMHAMKVSAISKKNYLSQNDKILNGTKLYLQKKRPL